MRAGWLAGWLAGGLAGWRNKLPKRHKHNPRLRHGQIISMPWPNRVFMRRIAVALGIDPRNDAESVVNLAYFRGTDAKSRGEMRLAVAYLGGFND
ncbi:hypothetical protein DPMN_006086 [Dreissena polymorpha]|uniref:Uncharacterized protein n=1 Tax=Dreissena polymorpha TaxID=45954 RepID=A0A9D4MRS4_DREPO|nr:hypothetical protein DPMN_006086 [Dreissena polymorpha]